MKAKILHKCLFILLSLGGFLFLGLHLDTQKIKSVRERRLLETLPRRFFVNAGQLEKYIADHIPFRDKLIDFYFWSGLGIDLGINQKQVIGKENYIFGIYSDYRNLDGYLVYQNKYRVSKQDEALYKKNFERITQFARKNNIKVYFLIPPMAARIYHRFVPDYILRDDAPSVSEQVEKIAAEFMTVVPMEKMLIEKSLVAQYPLIYKTDTHWSEDGAYEVYDKLMNTMQADFADVKPLSREAFNIEYVNQVYIPYLGTAPYFGNGHTCISGIDCNATVYRHYVFKKKSEVEEIWDKDFISSHYGGGLPHRVYIIGDSFALYLLHFLNPTFKEIRYYRYNRRGQEWGVLWDKCEKEMLEQKTDILILSPSDQKLEEFSRYFR